MPELPEVEIFKRYCDASARHQKCATVRVFDASVLRDVSGRKLRSVFCGQQFSYARHHGKWLK